MSLFKLRHTKHENTTSPSQLLFFSPQPSKEKDLDENSLQDYLTGHQIFRTQTKKNRKFNSTPFDQYKRTEPDEPHSSGPVEFSEVIEELKAKIKERDEKIIRLERLLHEKKHESSTQESFSKLFSAQEQRRSTQYEVNSLSSQIFGYKKQIIFLTHNNQELFEEVHELRKQCKSLKGELERSLKSNSQLSTRVKSLCKKVQQSSRESDILMEQKKQMMKNYEQELRLFKKLRKVCEGSGKSREERKLAHNKSCQRYR